MKTQKRHLTPSPTLGSRTWGRLALALAPRLSAPAACQGVGLRVVVRYDLLQHVHCKGRRG